MVWENTQGDQLVAKNRHNIAKTQLVPYFNLVVKSARGSIVTDVEGKRYIDLLATDSAMNVGHNHPRVITAMKKQIDEFISYDTGYFTNPTTIRLGERLAKLAPNPGHNKVAFGTSGSDATEAMIKFARAYTHRQYIVSFEGAYHGTTYGALSMSACNVDMARGIGPMLPGIVHVPFPNTYHCRPGETEHETAQRAFADFKRPFAEFLPSEETAAVILEPIQGDAGIIVPPREYMEAVDRFCHRHGILIGVDEVNQGLGRTGKLWSYQHFGLHPDLIATAKSLASGLPLSAVIGSATIMDAPGTSAYCFTGGGNPVNAAAALATLDVLHDEHLIEKSAVDGEYAKEKFIQLAQKHPCIGDVHMLGLNGGIEIVKNRQTKERDSLTAAKIIYHAFQKGLIMAKLGGNVLRFQPPLTISRNLIDEALLILDQVIKDVEENQVELPDELRHDGW